MLSFYLYLPVPGRLEVWSGGGAGRGQPSEVSFFPPSKGPGYRVPGLPSKHFFQLSSCLVLLLSGSHTVAQASLRSVAIFRLPCARLVKQTPKPGGSARLRSPYSQVLPGLCTGLHCQPEPSRVFYWVLVLWRHVVMFGGALDFFPMSRPLSFILFMRHFSI